jgi:alcohol dehydrogenase
MKDYNFYIPTRIVFGQKTINKINSFIPKETSKVLIVTDNAIAEKTDIISKVKKVLNFDYVIYQDTEENPSFKNVERGADIAKKNNVDFIIGVGGGSSMDAAKGIAILATNKGTLAEYISGKEIENAPLPIICIPTSSGTGSEVTPYAVFTDPDQEIKTAIAHDKIFPQTSIIDPELTYSMPEQVTVNTGLDALTHSIEAFLSTESFELNDQLAIQSIKIIIENLGNAAKGKHEAMDKMAHASMLGGIAIAHASTILPHIMGYPLTVFHNIPHGKANAIILPAFLNYMKKNSTAKEKVEIILNLFEKVDGVEKFINDLGVSTKLSDYGINKTEFEQFAKKTIVKGDVNITPAKLTEKSIVSIYEAAY